jgi:beta-N-acetylglucosaminidase
VSELNAYDKALKKREEDKALVGCGKMIKEEFIANALIKPGYPSLRDNLGRIE